MKKILLMLIAIAIISQITLAQVLPQLTLNSDKSEYRPNENINIFATVYNSYPYPVAWQLNAVLKHSDNLQNFPATSAQNEVLLKPAESKKIQMYNLSVGENFPPGLYVVIVNLMQGTHSINSQTLNFNITGTSKNIVFDIFACKDSACSTQSKVFLKNDIVFIVASVEKDVVLSSSYATPSGKEINMQLTDGKGSIEPKEIGTYTVKMTASKEVYLTTEKTIQFGVIAEEAKIQTYEKGVEKGVFSKYLVYTLVILVLSVVLAFLVYYLKRRHLEQKA
jgi:hypothetical protein